MAKANPEQTVKTLRKESPKIHRSLVTKSIWKHTRLITIQTKETQQLRMVDRIKVMIKITTCRKVKGIRMMRGTQEVRILKT